MFSIGSYIKCRGENEDILLHSSEHKIQSEDKSSTELSVREVFKIEEMILHPGTE